MRLLLPGALPGLRKRLADILNDAASQRNAARNEQPAPISTVARPSLLRRSSTKSGKAAGIGIPNDESCGGVGGGGSWGSHGAALDGRAGDAIRMKPWRRGGRHGFCQGNRNGGCGFAWRGPRKARSVAVGGGAHGINAVATAHGWLFMHLPSLEPTTPRYTTVMAHLHDSGYKYLFSHAELVQELRWKPSPRRACPSCSTTPRCGWKAATTSPQR